MFETQFEKRTDIGFVNSLIDGSYRLPRSHYFIEAAEKHDVDIDSLGWLLDLSKFGGHDYQHKMQAERLMEGISVNPEYWESNLVANDLLNARILFNDIPEWLTAKSTESGVHVEHSRLLATAAMFGTRNKRDSKVFWEQWINNLVGAQDWKALQENDLGLSADDMIDALDSLGWSDDLGYWKPTKDERTHLKVVIESGISPASAFVWNLATWWYEEEHGFKIDVADYHRLVASSLTPYEYTRYSRNGVRGIDDVLVMHINGVDPELAASAYAL